MMLSLLGSEPRLLDLGLYRLLPDPDGRRLPRHLPPGEHAGATRGGMAMVQQPETAAYDGMPRAALMTGMVDYVLPIEKMPDVLIKYVNHPYVGEASGLAAFDEVAPDHFRSILNLLRFHTGTDFQSYKTGTLSRRIQRRMGLRHVASNADYLDIGFVGAGPEVVGSDAGFRHPVPAAKLFHQLPQGSAAQAP